MGRIFPLAALFAGCGSKASPTLEPSLTYSPCRRLRFGMVETVHVRQAERGAHNTDRAGCFRDRPTKLAVVRRARGNQCDRVRLPRNHKVEVRRANSGEARPNEPQAERRPADPLRTFPGRPKRTCTTSVGLELADDVLPSRAPMLTRPPLGAGSKPNGVARSPASTSEELFCRWKLSSRPWSSAADITQ